MRQVGHRLAQLLLMAKTRHGRLQHAAQPRRGMAIDDDFVNPGTQRALDLRRVGVQGEQGHGQSHG